MVKHLFTLSSMVILNSLLQVLSEITIAGKLHQQHNLLWRMGQCSLLSVVDFK